MRQKGIVTRNMRNAGGPELMDGKEIPNLGHLLGGDLCYKNSFCAPSAISSAALETKFSLPGAVSQPRERESTDRHQLPQRAGKREQRQPEIHETRSSVVSEKAG